jgi:hypothetical protein
MTFTALTLTAHPSVRHSNTAAAIGVLGVKKTADGLWFHFAHNTDSFVRIPRLIVPQD